MSEIINSPDLAAPVGFSHAVRAGDTVYLGGQVAQAPDGAVTGETIVEQFDVAAANLMTALRAAGGEPSDLVSLQVFVTAVSEYKASLRELGEVWRTHFGRHYPAMGLFGVTELFDPAAKVELMGVAVVRAARRMTAAARHPSQPRPGRPLRADPVAGHRDPGADRRRRGARARQPPAGRGAGRARAAGPPVRTRSRRARIELCLIREGLARGCTEAETAFALQGLGAYPIVQAGSEALKAQWIPGVAAGTAVAAFALTEPDAGSDPAALSLHAAPDGEGGYRLSGEKLWISNAPDADVYTVFARSAAATGARGLTAFAVPGDAPGLSGESRDMLAAHAIGSLTFDDVPVGPEQVLGEPGSGLPGGDARRLTSSGRASARSPSAWPAPRWSWPPPTRWSARPSASR